MERPRPSNILIRAFVLLFATLAIFLLGLIIFNATQQVEENPETLGDREQQLLK